MDLPIAHVFPSWHERTLDRMHLSITKIPKALKHSQHSLLCRLECERLTCQGLQGAGLRYLQIPPAFYSGRALSG